MTDWFRRKTWTPADEQEFFAKLIRARKHNHPQFLRIQALAIVLYIIVFVCAFVSARFARNKIIVARNIEFIKWKLKVEKLLIEFHQ